MCILLLSESQAWCNDQLSSRCILPPGILMLAASHPGLNCTSYQPDRKLLHKSFKRVLQSLFLNEVCQSPSTLPNTSHLCPCCSAISYRTTGEQRQIPIVAAAAWRPGHCRSRLLQCIIVPTTLPRCRIENFVSDDSLSSRGRSQQVLFHQQQKLPASGQLACSASHQ